MTELLELLKLTPEWKGAAEIFRRRELTKREENNLRVDRYAKVYEANRAAMILDVVLSNQRNYEKTVQPTVATWTEAHPGMTIAELAIHGPGKVKRLQKNKHRDEEATIIQVAEGLHRYCAERKLDDEDGVQQWATEVEPLRYFPVLDKYVGNVRGIGPALFAYLRMRSGANAIKPDQRVIAGLREAALQFGSKHDCLTYLAVAEAMTDEIGITRLHF